MPTREEMQIILTARDQTGAAFGSVKNNVAAVGGAVRQLQGLFIAGAFAQGFAAIRRAVGDLDDIGDAAERVGLSARVFQTLRFQLGQFGGDAEMANRAMDKFSDSVAEAALGQGYLSKLFQANGVALRDANGQLRDNQSLLTDFARLVGNAGSAQEKLKIATDAFGRQSGPKMVTMLEALAREGWPGFIAGAEKAGAVMEDKVIKSADDLDRKFKALEASWGNFFKRMAVGAGEFFDSISRGAGRDPRSSRNLPVGRDLSRGRPLGDMSAFYDAVGIPSTPAPQRPSTVLPDAAAEAFKKSTDEMQKRIRLVEAETSAIGLNAEAHARLKVVIELEEQAKRANMEAGKGFNLITAEQRQKIDQLADSMFAAEKRQREMKTAWEGLNDAARFFGNTAAQALEDLFDKTKNGSEIAIQALKSFRNQLLQAILTGEGSLAKILGLASSSGGAGGIFGSIVKAFMPGGGEATGAEWVAAGAGVGPFAAMHSGGVVGQVSATRYIHPAVFADAQRYHSGGMIGPGEQPIIARDGEEVGWPGALAKKYGSRVTVNVINNGGVDVGMQQTERGGNIDIDVMIERKITKTLASGAADRALAARSGVSPTVARR